MDIKRSYYEDIELFQNKTVLVGSLLFFVLLLLLPWIVARTHILGLSVYLLNLIIIHCIVAIGLNILVGYTGQISMGHAGFFAIGAFTTVMFITQLGIPFVLALPAAAFISAGFRFRFIGRRFITESPLAPL